jgi:peptidoglycan/xylan/chitin deacetylase (PgdA/CDA1 family)
MDECDEILQRIAGVKTKLIRAPYGSRPYMDINLRNLVKDSGYILWDWHVDCLDALENDNPVKDTIDTIKKEIYEYEVKNVNPIILFHNEERTLKVLSHIIVYLKERGYRFESINENMEPIMFWSDMDKNYETYIAGKDDTLRSIAEKVNVSLKE